MTMGTVAVTRIPGLRRAAAALSMLWIATMISAGMVFLTQTLLARKMGPAAYGLFASSLATVTMIAPMAGFGLSQLRLKVYGAEGWAADRWLKPSLHFSTITTLVAMSLVVGWALMGVSAGPTRFHLLVLTPVILSLLASDLVGSKLRLEERYRALAFWQLLTPSARFAVALVLALGPVLHFDFVPWGYCAVSLAVVALAMPHLHALFHGQMQLHGHGPRNADAMPTASPSMAELWSEAWAYGLTAVLYPIFFQVSTVMLKYLGNDSQAGLYGVAMSVMAAIYLIPTTIYHRFLLSKLHRWAVHDKPKFWLVYRQGIVAMLISGLAIGIGLASLAPWVIPKVFGEHYRGVAPILMVLAICPPIRFLSTAVGSVLLTGKHMRFRVWAMGAAAAVTILFNLILIPGFHGLGAAWATVLGEIVLLFFMCMGARKHSVEFKEETPHQ